MMIFYRVVLFFLFLMICWCFNWSICMWWRQINSNLPSRRLVRDSFEWCWSSASSSSSISGRTICCLLSGTLKLASDWKYDQKHILSTSFLTSCHLLIPCMFSSWSAWTPLCKEWDSSACPSRSLWPREGCGQDPSGYHSRERRPKMCLNIMFQEMLAELPQFRECIHERSTLLTYIYQRFL